MVAIATIRHNLTNCQSWCLEKRCGLSAVRVAAAEVHLTITFLSFPTFFAADKCIRKSHFYHFKVFESANAFNTTVAGADPLMSWFHLKIIFSPYGQKIYLSEQTNKQTDKQTKASETQDNIKPHNFGFMQRLFSVKDFYLFSFYPTILIHFAVKLMVVQEW